MINQSAFEPIYLYFQSHALFIVPTFQRPFRWGQTQIDTLIDDFAQASAGAGDHYLSPVHLIEVDTCAPWGLKLLNLYTDPAICPPLPVSASGGTGLVDVNGIPVKVFLVIDGQQRLMALLALLTACAVPLGSTSIAIGGTIYPKLIAASPAEDAAIRSELGLPALPSGVASTPAAVRIRKAFSHAKGRVAAGVTLPSHFLQRQAKVLGVCLDPPFGLGAFLTLNDRGLPLTTLEKLKAHCMYLDGQSPVPNPAAVHTVFGELYHSIEGTNSLIDDDQAVQIATLFHITCFTSMVRLPQPMSFGGVRSSVSSKDLPLPATSMRAIWVSFWTRCGTSLRRIPT